MDGITKERAVLKRLGYAGARHDAVRLVNELIKNRQEDDMRLAVLEGFWAYEKIAALDIRVKAFLFCPELVHSAEEWRMAGNIAGRADTALIVSASTCRRLSPRDDPEGSFLVCELPQSELDSLPSGGDSLLVVLDGLEKPGNIGAILRIADGAGCDGVVVCRKRVKLTNHRVIKASMGAAFTLPFLETEAETLIDWLEGNGYRIVLADPHARKRYYEADYSGRLALVIGNENHGLAGTWYHRRNEAVSIPMFGRCDSLNAGLAAAIVIYEASLKLKGMR